MRDTKAKPDISGVTAFIRFVLFALTFFILLTLASRILIPKSNRDLLYFNAGGIFSLPKNSLDYVVIGNSNAVEGFSPLDIWNGFGYAGYTCGEPWQNTAGSYYMLKTILKTQSPKVVILDTDTLYERKSTLTSLENDLTIAVQHYYSVFRYHNYWKRLSITDFLMKDNYSWHHSDYGHMVLTKINAYNGSKYMSPTDKIQKMTPQIEYYLDKIVNLCRDSGIALILVSIPSPTYWNMAQHNAVTQYAASHDVKYLDLNLNYQDYGLDWATDTRDRGEHLNCYGARKVSLYLGKYISENYRLLSHAGDSAYEYWNRDYASYYKYISTSAPSN